MSPVLRLTGVMARLGVDIDPPDWDLLMHWATQGQHIVPEIMPLLSQCLHGGPTKDLIRWVRHHNSKAHILNYLRSAQTVLIDAVISWMAPFIEFRPEPVAACGQCPTPRHPNCPLGGQPIEGIVLSGGIALNTLLATAVRRHFGLPVHVAPLPGDTGASVGALFHGIRELPWPGMGLGAKLQGLEVLSADMLHKAPAHPLNVANQLRTGRLVGVLRGPQPLGFQGLGLRSYLALPSEGALQHMFRLECRPPATFPMILTSDDAVTEVVHDDVRSPFASFASYLTPRAQAPLPTSLRNVTVFTVSNASDPWLFAVLQAVPASYLLTGPITTRCKAIKARCHIAPVNSVRDVLTALTSGDLDALVIDESLYTHSAG
uniref:Uncharacterized protein n=1 Tax=Eutreptiella gymnastica TaxID=73025 RepID=A0A7S4CG16_9EUGL